MLKTMCEILPWAYWLMSSPYRMKETKTNCNLYAIWE